MNCSILIYPVGQSACTLLCQHWNSSMTSLPASDFSSMKKRRWNLTIFFLINIRRFLTNILQYVCKIHKTISMVELNSFENERGSLKNLLFCNIHLALTDMEVSSFFSSYSCSIQTHRKTPFVISNQHWGPSSSVCLLLAVINVRYSTESVRPKQNKLSLDLC